VNAGDLQRAAYRGVTGAATLLALPLAARDRRTAVFYGGARAGDLGGPLVKLRHLQRRFPNRPLGFSLVYLLSNALYLPGRVIDAVGRRGVPIVLNQNGVFYPAWYPHGWERENARMARVHAAASHVLYQSEFCRRAAERFLGARAGDSEILYNAVDTAAFVPAPPGSARPFTFLITGKIGAAVAYRLTSSVAGLAAARKGGLDVRLRIAGPVAGEAQRAALALADRLGIADALAFTGPYGEADARAVYQAADAYLTTKHNDPCPNAVIEALACGLPVLYSESGGVPELVGTEAGVALAVEATFAETPVPDASAIAAGMAEIMAGRDRMAAAARARAVARFDLGAWLNRHAALFAAILERQSVS
jgi:glycosyltransferase involved in cell wall biosynthesis